MRQYSREFLLRGNLPTLIKANGGEEKYQAGGKFFSQTTKVLEVADEG